MFLAPHTIYPASSHPAAHGTRRGSKETWGQGSLRGRGGDGGKQPPIPVPSYLTHLTHAPVSPPPSHTLVFLRNIEAGSVEERVLSLPSLSLCLRTANNGPYTFPAHSQKPCPTPSASSNPAPNFQAQIPRREWSPDHSCLPLGHSATPRLLSTEPH